MAVPVEMPVTIPVNAPTEAIEGSLLFHEPPARLFEKVVELPSHTTGMPVIAPGTGNTVTRVEVVHPSKDVYTIFVLPAVRPVTTPDVMPIPAVPGLLLLQVPPVVASLNVVELPTHTEVIPVIEAGNGFTVIVVVTEQLPVVV